MFITKVYKRQGDSHAKMLMTDPRQWKMVDSLPSPLTHHIFWPEATPFFY